MTWRSSTKFKIGEVVHYLDPDDIGGECVKCLVIDGEGHHIEIEEEDDWIAQSDKIYDYDREAWHREEECPN